MSQEDLGERQVALTTIVVVLAGAWGWKITVPYFN